MYNITLLCSIIIAICIAIKLIFWSFITPKSFSEFLISFVKIFSLYDLHDAPSSQWRRFGKINNFLNIIIWICTAVIAIQTFKSFLGVVGGGEE
jgi:hypothetical protein